MPRYVALLRGINVGGVRVPMATLREVAMDLGWSDVSTHLNSCNLLLTADEPPTAVSERLRAGLVESVGVDTPILVRTPAELVDAQARNPFAGEAHDERRVQIAFVADGVTLDGLEPLSSDGPEEVALGARELFLHYPDGLARSRLDLKLVERWVGGHATTRGTRTVRGLIERT
jgi:uncharacterized protein (DUF1697 family)